MGWVAAFRRQHNTWQGTAWEEKGSKRTPHRSVREDEMVTQTMGSTQACVRLASVWECLGKHAFFSPPTPAHAQNTLLPCLEHMVHQQRHLAALTPGSCASSLPVGSLGTATSSTTCGSSRVRRRAMNYFEAAAANLTFIQEIHCKHMLAAKSETQPCNNARLTGCFFGGGWVGTNQLIILRLIPCFSKRWSDICQCFHHPYTWIYKGCEHDHTEPGDLWKLYVFWSQWSSSGSFGLCQ